MRKKVHLTYQRVFVCLFKSTVLSHEGSTKQLNTTVVRQWVPPIFVVGGDTFLFVAPNRGKKEIFVHIPNSNPVKHIWI